MKESNRDFSIDKGFTLIELLASITLIMVLTVIVLGALRLSYKSLRSGEKITASTERLRTSLSIIDAQLQSSFLHMLSGEDKEKEGKICFAASREKLKFTSNYSLWGSRRGYLMVVYEVLENDNGRKTLQASESMVGCNSIKRTTLLDGLDDMYFEYYEQPQEGDPRWVEQWTDEQKTPGKIRLHMVDKSRHEVLIIPVRAANAKTVWSF
jgi:type II secretory pathway component PulJ